MKAAEIRELTDEEISIKLEEQRREYFNLRFQRTTQQLENPSKVKFARREIARILTIVNERKKAEDGTRS